MSEDPLALYSITSTMPSSDPSVLPSESDYEAICAAVMETLRGRWFLAEYARRNRHSDTKVVLSAIERIEAMIRGDSVAPPTDRFRTELAEMAQAIARTKSEIASIKPEAEQPGKIFEASEELDSIVHTTEKATSSILAAAEQIQEIAWTVREQDLAAPICDQLDALATDIYTACSFQDLTGQRIQKVIHAMRYLEERIDTMINIWDDNVSTQAGSTSSVAAAAPAAAPQPVHHDVTQDDLDQTDVDMVMDPAQQDAAVRAEPSAVAVTIDHEPLQSTESLQTAASLQFAESLHPAETLAPAESQEPVALYPVAELAPEPQAAPVSFAHESFLHDSFTEESFHEEDSTEQSFAPESSAQEPHALESHALEPHAPEIHAPEAHAAETHAAEAHAPVELAASEEPEEIPVFFRAMEPSSPVAEATPVEDTHTSVPEASLAQAAKVEPQTVAGTETDVLAPTIAAVREALFGAFPGLADLKTQENDTTSETAAPASVVAYEPVAGFDAPALAVAEQALPAMEAEPQPDITAVAEPDNQVIEIAQVTEPVADEIEQRATPTLVGPADFLLESMPLPALRALAIVSPYSESEPEAAIETAQYETAARYETAAPEIAPIGLVGEPSISNAPTGWVAAFEAEVNDAEVAASETSEAQPALIDTTAAEIAEIEIAVAEIAESEIVFIDTAESETSDIEGAKTEIAAVDAPAHLANALETAGPALTLVPAGALDLDIVEVAEIEAVATAPVAPEALAEPDIIQSDVEELAKLETPEPVEAKSEVQEAAEDEERPVVRTAMPEVTFASVAPTMMPMETTRAEPDGERFAAAATVTPTQGEFIPFGYTAPPRPSASATPTIYSTSPYLESSLPVLESSRPVAAHVIKADPLAVIMTMTDDEKIALFS